MLRVRAEQVCSDPSFLAIRLNGNPDEHDNHVEALALAAIELVGPHAVLLLVPVRTSRAVHSSSADVGLAVGGGGLGAGGNVRLLRLGLGTSAGLVQGGCGDEVLDDGAVASELEGGGSGALGGRLGDDSLQHGADNGRVPLLSLRMVVELGAADGVGAGISGNLLEAVEGDRRSSHYEGWNGCQVEMEMEG